MAMRSHLDFIIADLAQLLFRAVGTSRRVARRRMLKLAVLGVNADFVDAVVLVKLVLVRG